jgi:hypothetical protein
MSLLVILAFLFTLILFFLSIVVTIGCVARSIRTWYEKRHAAAISAKSAPPTAQPAAQVSHRVRHA